MNNGVNDIMTQASLLTIAKRRLKLYLTSSSETYVSSARPLSRIGYKMAFRRPSLISNAQGLKSGWLQVTSLKPPSVSPSHTGQRMRILSIVTAIGHSTNLISPQSNIIVIRKGGANSRPVYQQMTNAVEEFFPDSDLVEEFKQKPAPRRSTSSTHGAGDKAYPLRRVNTGMSSVVGADNGQRPGGFVLVVDGAALETVSPSHMIQRFFLPSDRP